MPRNDRDAIDWSLTIWEGAEREQLRRWAALSLEEILRAQEEMQELAERMSTKPRDDRPQNDVAHPQDHCR